MSVLVRWKVLSCLLRLLREKCQNYTVDVRQRVGSTRSLERGFQRGHFPAEWKLLSSDRLLPRYTFPTQGDPFFPLWARTAFVLQMK